MVRRSAVLPIAELVLERVHGYTGTGSMAPCLGMRARGSGGDGDGGGDVDSINGHTVMGDKRGEGGGSRGSREGSKGGGGGGGGGGSGGTRGTVTSAAIVYSSAAAVVVMDAVTREQRFHLGHTDDVSALAVSPDGVWAATGELGRAPVVRQGLTITLF